MANHNSNDDKEQKSTDQAWARLQSTLENEPINSIWAEWSKNAERAHTEDLVNVRKENDSASADRVAGPVLHVETQSAESPNNNKTAKRSRRVMSRRRKWATAAAGVAVFAAILSTPAGNTAMASILNQFRMQNVTVVQEDDLNNIFSQVAENGNMNEAVNKFGAFSNASGTISGDIPFDKVSDRIGINPPASVQEDVNPTVYVSPSQKLTLTLNVDEVNKLMKRMGADQLLPDSVDGKAITLEVPESVHYNLSPDKNHWSNLMQMNTPVLTVDPSIEVEEALKAVINFPLLPEYLKSSLKQSSILSGEIPMPLIAGDQSEQMTVGTTVVILDQYEYGQEAAYNATWVQNGQLFQFSGGDVYKDKVKFLAKLQELIQS